MKVLFIDTDGVCIDMALQAQWAGHQVKVFISPMRCDNIGRGLVNRVNDWRDWMKWADLIVMTAVGKYMRELDGYFEKGYPILGTNLDAAQLEVDRETGCETFDRVGMDCLPYRAFHNIDEGIAYIKRTKGTYVSKPLHDNADKSTTYVSSGPDDMIYMLSKWKKQGKDYPFFLQEKIDAIGEVGVSGWFGPKGWADMWEEDFEHKPLMPGNIGPNTGEMGNVCKYVEQSKLAEKFLLPMTDTLHALNFRGNFAMGMIVASDGKLYPLECTARLGWPITFMQTELHRVPMVEWFKALLDGETRLRVRQDITCGLVVGIKPFPYEAYAEPEICEGHPLLGVDQGNMDSIHLAQVRAGKALVGDSLREQDVFVTAGCYVACCTGRGGSIKIARERAIKTAKSLRIPNSPMYRNDIGSNLGGVITKLKSKGYLEEWPDADQ